MSLIASSGLVKSMSSVLVDEVGRSYTHLQGSMSCGCFWLY